jgi:hypothetical protein
MSETVLAALIAASATILTTMLQLKISLGRDSGPAARATSSSRKKPKLPAMLLGVMLTAAAVGGFALSQWFSEHERAQQKELRQELQARITEISRTAGELKQSRLDTFAEVETEVLRRMGGSGIVSLATVGPCHGKPVTVVTPDAADAAATTNGANNGGPSASSANPPSAAGSAASGGTSATDSGPRASSAQPSTSAASAAPAAPSACAEADATQVMLCVPIPSNAVVSHVDLFTRLADGDAPWNASQVSAGQETDQARFSEKKSESLADDGMKHVCHMFANWSTQHARVARMIVRYAIPAEALEPQTQVSHKGVAATTSSAGALAVR